MGENPNSKAVHYAISMKIALNMTQTHIGIVNKLLSLIYYLFILELYYDNKNLLVS